MNQIEAQEKVEFGDFQTPVYLAEQICALLYKLGVRPKTVLEPTCGRGNLLLAAINQFPDTEQVFGFDINIEYLHLLERQPSVQENRKKVQLVPGDFFCLDWEGIVSTFPEPLLVVGNPPWVTNSVLSSLQSDNLPVKSNFQNQTGIEAITGASNFDISEWMLQQMVGWLNGRQGLLAMLCKTAVARKLLLHIWHGNQLPVAALYLIDAQEAFQASVDATLFVVDSRTKTEAKICDVYPSLLSTAPIAQIGFSQGQLIANVECFRKWQHLMQKGKTPYQWRSGVKHDCASVMELERVNGSYINKLGESINLESNYLYPMLKSADIANGDVTQPFRYMLVTQTSVGEDTKAIQLTAQKTWAYLQAHGEYLDGRKSRIYKNRPRFSVFGVGSYSFAPWKVAISGLYKLLKFTAVGPSQNKPIVLDDTCYFLPCHSKEEAKLLARLLNSESARQFFQSFIFWDNKRPITKKILQQLDLFALAKELGQLEHLNAILSEKQSPSHFQQLPLLEEPGD